MVNIYSINEILKASEKILAYKKEKKDILNSIDDIVEKKMTDKKLLVIPEHNKINATVPPHIETIIVNAENSQLIKKEITSNSTKNNEKQNLIIEDTISQKELINDLYKTFGKKIKKNTLQLILELRKDIISLTRNISTLKDNKKQTEKVNNKLNKNINNLVDVEKNLKNNLEQSIIGFNKLNSQHKDLKANFETLDEKYLNNKNKLSNSIEINNQLDNNLKRSAESFASLYDKHNNLKLSFNTLEEDLNYKQKKLSVFDEVNKDQENKIKRLEEKLIEYKNNEFTLSSKVEKLEKHIFANNVKEDELENKNKILEKKNIELKTKLESAGHVDIYLEEINELRLKNKDLVNTIEKLKSYEDNNDQNLNIIQELENKIKYYQEENIRISNQLYETNKRFDIIKSEIEVLQDQRSNLVAKINSVNDVIGNSKVVTNVFKNSQPQNTKILVEDPAIKKVEKTKDLNEEILNIFSK